MLRAAMEFCAVVEGIKTQCGFVGAAVEKRISPLRNSLCELLRSK
jgi:hypothetical protein